jgi:hypothetical protein
MVTTRSPASREVQISTNFMATIEEAGQAGSKRSVAAVPAAVMLPGVCSGLLLVLLVLVLLLLVVLVLLLV